AVRSGGGDRAIGSAGHSYWSDREGGCRGDCVKRNRTGAAVWREKGNNQLHRDGVDWIRSVVIGGAVELEGGKDFVVWADYFAGKRSVRIGNLADDEGISGAGINRDRTRRTGRRYGFEDVAYSRSLTNKHARR